MDSLDVTLVIIAAVIIAINQALKEAKQLSAHLPRFFTSSRWNYVPAALVAAAAVVYMLRPGDGPRPTTASPVALTIPAPVKTPEPKQSKEVQGANKKIIKEYQLPPGDLQNLSNEELRQVSYAYASKLSDLFQKYGGEHSHVEFGNGFSPTERGSRLLEIEREFSKTFRSQYISDIVRLKTELARRLNHRKNKFSYARSGTLSISEALYAEEDIKKMAAELP